MLSSDREILIDIQGQLVKINTRLDRIESRMDKLETCMGRLEDRMTLLEHDMITLQTSVYWGLATIGIFLAGITIIPSVISLFRKPEPKSNDKIELTFSQFLDIWMRGGNHSSKSEK